jgi:hypothetical protein
MAHDLVYAVVARHEFHVPETKDVIKRRTFEGEKIKKDIFYFLLKVRNILPLISLIIDSFLSFFLIYMIVCIANFILEFTIISYPPAYLLCIFIISCFLLFSLLLIVEIVVVIKLHIPERMLVHKQGSDI